MKEVYFEKIDCINTKTRFYLIQKISQIKKKLN